MAIAVSVCAAYVNTYTCHNIHGGKWIYEPTLFLAKNKNEDSDLGWTAYLKINLDKLMSCRVFF